MSKHIILFTAALLLPVFTWAQQLTAAEAGEGIAVIFETDMGNDVDDALAIDMLYKYADLGTINLLAVMTNKTNSYSAEYIDILNTWYGRPALPIGIVRNGADSGGDDNYAAKVCLMKDHKGRPLFRRSLKDTTALPDAHRLYRQLLSQQPDHSVVIISTGFSTNLARLLDTTADEYSPLTGRELVARKVKTLIAMAGGFDGSNRPEYNVFNDIPSAKKVFHEWPTELVTSPWEVGNAIEFPVTSIEAKGQQLMNKKGKKRSEALRYSPVVEGYKAYLPMPYDRATWDLTSVLYAVEGPDWFGLSEKGFIHVDDKGVTSFSPDPAGNRRYLITTRAQNHRILQHFVNIFDR